MSPVAVSADRRFHRAHVKPARRRAAWRRVVVAAVKYALVLGLVAVGVVKVAAFVSTSPLLGIARITVTGNQRVPSETVVALLNGLEGQNIVFADLDRWRAAVLESAWVKDATLHRSLPATIEVQVLERTPIAIGRIGGRLYLVDETGATIDEYGPHYGNLDLPIVDGLSSSSDSRTADADRAALAARLIVDLRRKPAVVERLSQVDVSDLHNATVLLTDDGAELRVGDSHFLERVESFISLSAALRQRVPDIDYVDLRFDGRVYVRPSAGGRGASHAAGRPAISRVTDARGR
jgi:cell division protein FtsQ